jgi:hypothetical protein
LSASGQIDQTLTFPLKSTPLARKSDCPVMGPKEAAYLFLFGSTKVDSGQSWHRTNTPGAHSSGRIDKWKRLSTRKKALRIGPAVDTNFHTGESSRVAIRFSRATIACTSSSFFGV